MLYCYNADLVLISIVLSQIVYLCHDR